MRLGLCGGSFNPIHIGHLVCARAVAEQLGLERIVLIPAAEPPHKPRAALAHASDRLAMTRLAVAGDALFDVCDIELSRPGPSYTIDTVRALRSMRGDSDEWHWLIGADTLPELATWHRIAELVHDVCFVTMVRPGFAIRTIADVPALERLLDRPAIERLLDNQLKTPAIDISATNIRQRVMAGLSIRYLTPPPVAQYITERRLYLHQ